MELTETGLVQTEWVEQVELARRFKFRRDSTGFFEREAAPGARFVHENFLWKLEGGRLHLKFAHARSWTDLAATLRAGTAPDDARVGVRELVLERDPYAWTMEERALGELVLASDRGAALP